MKQISLALVLKRFRLYTYKKRFDGLKSKYRESYSDLDKPAREKFIDESEELLGLVYSIGEMGQSLEDEIKQFIKEQRDALNKPPFHSVLFDSLRKRAGRIIISTEPVVGKPNPVRAFIRHREKTIHTSPNTNHADIRKKHVERFKK